MNDKEIELLAKLIANNYKLEMISEKMLETILHLDLEEHSKICRQIEYIKSQDDDIFTQFNIEVISLEGNDYMDGYPVDYQNNDEYADKSNCFISKMISPIIKKEGKVIQKGKAILKNKE